MYISLVKDSHTLDKFQQLNTYNTFLNTKQTRNIKEPSPSVLSFSIETLNGFIQLVREKYDRDNMSLLNQEEISLLNQEETYSILPFKRFALLASRAIGGLHLN